MTSGGGGRRVQERSAGRTEVRRLAVVFVCLFCMTDFVFSLSRCFSDLDSAVSSGGLDQILTPPAGQSPTQPGTRSFFQSVVVTKVVKPDGVRSCWLQRLHRPSQQILDRFFFSCSSSQTVEERRTVRDGQGREETTVTRSGPEPEAGPLVPGRLTHLQQRSPSQRFLSRC